MSSLNLSSVYALLRKMRIWGAFKVSQGHMKLKQGIEPGREYKHNELRSIFRLTDEAEDLSNCGQTTRPEVE